MLTDQLLDVGATLCDRYRIERVLGSGGMATVYLAQDLETNSPVAVKVLRDNLSAVVGRQRFIQEVRIASQLEHPGIVRIHGSYESDGVLYCIMPYVDGETLRDLLAREKQLPIARVVEIGCEVASALAYAHDKGFVHRDIKPANILLSHGRPLVADFGLARAITSSTTTQSFTTSGIVIGTPAYMAPEQAIGDRDIDGRADIYGLGCVLYEALAGEPPFTGLNAWNLAARHAAQPPVPVRKLRRALPPALEKVVMRALEKAPADRYATAREFGNALAEAGRAVPDAAPPPWRWAAMAAALLAVVGALWWGGRSMRTPHAPLVSFIIPPPTGVQFSDDLRDVSAVSPDGRDIIIAGTDSTGVRHLWLRALAARDAAVISNTDAGTDAFWSPDGRSIGFFRRGALVVTRRDGTSSRTLVSGLEEPRGGSWASDATILYAPGTHSGLFAVSLKDLTTRQVTSPSAARGEIGHMWPRALPDGRDFLYFVSSDVDSVRGIYLGSLASESGRRVVGSSASAVYADGYLLYVRSGALVAQRLDIRRAALTGPVRVIADSIATSHEYYGAFSASQNGVLVYAGGRSRDISRLTWLDSTGATRGYASGDGYLRNPKLSANGRYLAYETYRETDSDIRWMDVATGASNVVPDGGAQAADPVWSPDETSLAYVVERPGDWAVFRKRIDRSGGPELVYRAPRYMVLIDWAPDGMLILAERGDTGDWDLVGRPLAAVDAARLLAGGAGHQVDGRVSPEGRHLAYVSTESGDAQVYVQEYPSGSRCQMSVSGGHQPAWARNGTLYFLSSNGMVMRTRLDLTRATPCPSSAPVPLFQTPIRNPSSARSFFDVSLSSGLLLVNLPSVHEGAWLTGITNWLAATAAER